MRLRKWVEFFVESMIVERNKQHNSISEVIQQQLLEKQFDIYFIFHFAYWCVDSFISKGEERRRFIVGLVSKVEKEIISFFL